VNKGETGRGVGVRLGNFGTQEESITGKVEKGVKRKIKALERIWRRQRRNVRKGGVIEAQGGGGRFNYGTKGMNSMLVIL